MKGIRGREEEEHSARPAYNPLQFPCNLSATIENGYGA